MITTRKNRLDEKKQQKKLILAIAGMIAIVVFFVMFGVKILIGFSVFVDTIRGSAPTPMTLNNKQILFPPTMDPLPIATYSSMLRITGSGTPGLTLTAYDNAKELKKTIIAGNGGYALQVSSLKDGNHVLTAKVSDSKGNSSDPSSALTILIKTTKPELTIDSPDDRATITGESSLTTISGSSENDTSVTINGRIAVIRPDNSFSYSYPLSEGDNSIKIVATDLAGNTSTVERTITYHK